MSRSPTAPSTAGLRRGAEKRAAKPWLGGFTCLASVAWLACSQPAEQQDGEGAEAPVGPVASAERWLERETPLPTREEVVALSDQIAISASREPDAGAQAKLYALAAALRARLYRLDAREADAREALELYASASRIDPVPESACARERSRAMLVGELSRSASASFRELYLVKRRFESTLGNAEGSCLARLGRDLGLAGGFRPSEAELAALDAEGGRRELRPLTPTPPPGSAEPHASSGPAVVPADSAIVVSPQGLEPARAPVKFTGIDHYASEHGARVVMHLEGATSFQVGQLAGDDRAGKGPRVFIDIDKARLDKVPREIEGKGVLERIRSAPRDGGARVVLDLERELTRRVFYLPEPFRIVVDLSSRAVAPGTEKAGPRQVKRVVIDPGHGGHDAGAVGPTGLAEKTVTLDIAHRIAPLLAHELGVETLLTRDRDVYVPLEERTARANAFQADLFISVHCNASENGEARGVEVFVLDSSKDTSRASARVAAIENGLGSSKTLDPAALDAHMSHVLAGLSTGATSARSRKLGDLLLRSTMASLGERYPDTRDHGLKSAGFYVLAGAEMPAVLFETSFVSNPDDEARLAKADYRQKLADAVVNAVRAFREGK
jgi:N-acetylmuramoyl-L-alanine amidase